jgi:hypothetical protein
MEIQSYILVLSVPIGAHMIMRGNVIIIISLLETELQQIFLHLDRGVVFVKIVEVLCKYSRKWAQDGVVGIVTLWAGHFRDWIAMRARFTTPSPLYRGASTPLVNF